jgi:hypothetical protein
MARAPGDALQASVPGELAFDVGPAAPGLAPCGTTDRFGTAPCATPAVQATGRANHAGRGADADRRRVEIRLDRRYVLRGLACAMAPGAAVWPGLLEASVPASPPAPQAQPGGGDWQHQPLNKRKKPTQYRLLGGESDWQIEARAERSASLFLHPAAIDLSAFPRIAWRWQIRVAPTRPDITQSDGEDAAARIVLCFDGDRRRLSRTERLTLAMSDRLSGRETPFATLMYVAAPGLAVGTLVPNPYTRRIQMIVVDSPEAGKGTEWRSFRRDIVADYRRAWGETPLRLTAYGVMTDSDNTGSTAVAHYAGLRFLPPA